MGDVNTAGIACILDCTRILRRRPVYPGPNVQTRRGASGPGYHTFESFEVAILLKYLFDSNFAWIHLIVKDLYLTSAVHAHQFFRLPFESCSLNNRTYVYLFLVVSH